MKRMTMLLTLLAGAAVAWAATTATVSIRNLQFSPATITIHKGQSVTWTNSDDRDHTVVAENGSFSSGNLSSGKSFTHQFDTAGKYPYGSKYYPRMKGIVVVE